MFGHIFLEIEYAQNILKKQSFNAFHSGLMLSNFLLLLPFLFLLFVEIRHIRRK